jgi:Zn-finger nucleic acid-binding protein
MDRTLTELTCPKCAGQMRAQERQGFVIEVCTTCRGVFLDRGELDRLLDLEAAATRPRGTSSAAPLGGPSADPPVGYDPRGPGYDRRDPGWDRRDRRDWDDDDDDDDDRQRGGRRRGGFLEDLFGGFGD